MFEVSDLGLDEMIFPLRDLPSSWQIGGKNFGAWRAGPEKDPTRVHAGCDLFAGIGKPVISVGDGTVMFSRPFGMPKQKRFENVNVWEVMVDYGEFQIRYCEMLGSAVGIAPGSKVSQGQTIGYVGKLHIHSMLHFEMYKGPSRQYPSQEGNENYLYVPNAPYGRRSDLLNPTIYLFVLAQNILKTPSF